MIIDYLWFIGWWAWQFLALIGALFLWGFIVHCRRRYREEQEELDQAIDRYV